jgi:hypothetical protein
MHAGKWLPVPVFLFCMHAVITSVSVFLFCMHAGD